MIDLTDRHEAGTFRAHPAAACPGYPACEDAAALISPLAVVEDGARLGAGTGVWRWSLVRAGAVAGRNCKIGTGVVIGPDVTLGDGCKVEDGAKLYGPLTLGDGVFIGPNAVICNDRHPSAARLDWSPPAGQLTRIEAGASVGANASVMPGVTIGAFAMVGAGAVVSRDVPPRRTVLGVPARGVRGKA